MEKNKIDKLKELISQLENTIGNECYNGNIQNYGSGGEWMGEGREFKYPVKYLDHIDNLWNKRTYLSKSMTADEIISAYYAFGANQLHIGKAIFKVIELMEQRYGIDFEELEKQKT